MSVVSGYNINMSIDKELFKDNVEKAFQNNYGIKPIHLQGFISTIEAGYIESKGDSEKLAKTIFNIMVKSYGMNTARKTAEKILYR